MNKSNLIHFSAQAKRAAKNAKRRKAAVARRRAKAKEIRDAAETRYRAALALVKRENEKPRLTKSVREAIQRGDLEL